MKTTIYRRPSLNAGLDDRRLAFHRFRESIPATYRSQAAQDIFVATLNGFKNDGSFLEIGSAWPVYINNTFSLEGGLGWRGLMVERQKEQPFPDQARNSIHAFGDSHAGALGACDNVSAHHLGPKLCYSFGRDKLNAVNIRNYGLKDGDTLIFCFGEIDCRCHVHKHVSATASFEMVIDEIVDRYVEAVELHVKTCGIKLAQVCIYNVVPAVEKHNFAESTEWPFLGSNQERKEYVLYFNKILSEKCRKNNFIFIDVYSKYADERGFLSKEFSDGSVHIKNPIYLEEFIEAYLVPPSPLSEASGTFNTLEAYKKERPLSKHLIKDATEIDFKKELEEGNFPRVIDYLQIDLYTENRSTLTTLENIDRDVLDHYAFSTITLEHDFYAKDQYNTRDVSREILKNRGYLLLFGDICHLSNPFEDWYVHPDIVDMDFVKRISSVRSRLEGDSIGWGHAINIIAKSFNSYQNEF